MYMSIWEHRLKTLENSWIKRVSIFQNRKRQVSDKDRRAPASSSPLPRQFPTMHQCLLWCFVGQVLLTALPNVHFLRVRNSANPSVGLAAATSCVNIVSPTSHSRPLSEAFVHAQFCKGPLYLFGIARTCLTRTTALPRTGDVLHNATNAHYGKNVGREPTQDQRMTVHMILLLHPGIDAGIRRRAFRARSFGISCGCRAMSDRCRVCRAFPCYAHSCPP
jgi:hypothetical protein